MASLTQYIGKGITFPFRFNSSGSVDRTTDQLVEQINSSIRLILSTYYKEVPGLPTKGSEFVGDVRMSSKEDREDLAANIIESLTDQEKRINVRNIRFPSLDINPFEEDENYLPIVIDYSLKNSFDTIAGSVSTFIPLR